MTVQNGEKIEATKYYFDKDNIFLIMLEESSQHVDVEEKILFSFSCYNFDKILLYEVSKLNLISNQYELVLVDVRCTQRKLPKFMCKRKLVNADI